MPEAKDKLPGVNPLTKAKSLIAGAGPQIEQSDADVMQDPNQQPLVRALGATRDLIGKAMESRIGQALQILDMARGMSAVAGVKPEHIAALRQHGLDMLNEVINRGALEKRALGMPVGKQIPAPTIAGKLFGTSTTADPTEPKNRATVPLPPEYAEALQYVQQRYPRIFGHITSLTDVDALAQLQTGGAIRGASGGASYSTAKLPFPVKDRYKFSSLQLSPQVIERDNRTGMQMTKSGMPINYKPGTRQYPGGGQPPIDTIGHELTHVADRIALPDAEELYDFANTLPGSYNNNSQEIRARIQGGNLYEQYANYKAAKTPENPNPPLKIRPKKSK